MKQTVTITTKFTDDPKNPYEEISLEFVDAEDYEEFIEWYEKDREVGKKMILSILRAKKE